MSDNIVPRTVAEVAEDIAEPLGLRMPGDRAEILKHINRYREYLYSAYAKYRLFDSVTRCFCLHDFALECRNTCDCTAGCYKGITLPYDMDGVVAAWQSHEPVTLRSRWWDVHMGIQTQRHDDEVSLIRMPQMYATERDLTRISPIGVSNDNSDDDDKVVYVTATLDGGEQKTISFILGGGLVLSDDIVRSIDSVVLPNKRVGGISIWQDCDDIELARYSPGEPNVPSYQRYKLTTHGCGTKSVLIQGTRRYVDVWWDTDIVEIGSRLLVEAMARHFRYRESKDRAEQKVSQQAIAEADGLLNGIISRHRGRSVEDGASRPRKVNRTGRLNRTTRSRHESPRYH